VHLPNKAFYLQDNDGTDPIDSAHIPQDAEYGDMLQNGKLDADDTEFETFVKYIGAEFLTNDNGEAVPTKAVKRARDNEGKAIVSNMQTN
jgi:hypothetical protein